MKKAGTLLALTLFILLFLGNGNAFTEDQYVELLDDLDNIISISFDGKEEITLKYNNYTIKREESVSPAYEGTGNVINSDEVDGGQENIDVPIDERIPLNNDIYPVIGPDDRTMIKEMTQ